MSGFWRISGMSQLGEFQTALNERGARERELKRFLERHNHIISNCREKVRLAIFYFGVYLMHIEVNHNAINKLTHFILLIFLG